MKGFNQACNSILIFLIGMCLEFPEKKSAGISYIYIRSKIATAVKRV